MNNSNIVVNRSLSLFSEKMVILTVGIGMFLSTLDTGIINIASLFLEKDFYSTVAITAWSVTIYVMSLSATILLYVRTLDMTRFMEKYYNF